MKAGHVPSFFDKFSNGILNTIKNTPQYMTNLGTQVGNSALYYSENLLYYGSNIVTYLKKNHVLDKEVENIQNILGVVIK